MNLLLKLFHVPPHRHIQWDKFTSKPSFLPLRPPLTRPPACDQHCDVITHRKFLIKLVREGKQS